MTIPGLSHHASLLIFALLSVVGLVVLIARFRMNAFVALVLASLAMGIAAGMNLSDVATAFQNGVGKILGGIGMIITATIPMKNSANSVLRCVSAVCSVMAGGPRDHAVRPLRR